MSEQLIWINQFFCAAQVCKFFLRLTGDLCEQLLANLGGGLIKGEIRTVVLLSEPFLYAS